ncbi:hypothetical protein ABW19_dt0207826 [Dactylella cylindrospora]|nr:hypothetical protein ABW19_dt0207826 [Dactylella cylindrospora]
MGAGVSKERMDTFPESFQSPAFTVIAGPRRKKYILHREPLTRCSEYFKIMFSSKMREAETGELRLDTEVDNEEAFDMFVQFAYLGEYSAKGNEAKDIVNLLLHARVYTLAEKFMALSLKELSLKKAGEEMESLADSKASGRMVDSFASQALEAIKVIYDGTFDEHTGRLPGSIDSTKGTTAKKVERDEFRILMANICAYFVVRLRKVDGFFSTIKEYPDFATDMLMFAGRGGSITFKDGKLRVPSYF